MHAKSNRFVGEVLLYIYYIMESFISLITTRLHREKLPVNGSKVYYSRHLPLPQRPRKVNIIYYELIASIQFVMLFHMVLVENTHSLENIVYLRVTFTV